MKKMGEFKKGAASFYIVAISTLLLVIIATSFIAIIISEITRTSNNDLAQSAYDSALAGVEDAKLAYYNYQNCLKSGADKASGLNRDGTVDCREVRYLVEESDDCSMTAKIVGRRSDVGGEDGESEVIVEEGASGANNMQQAYTCVVFKTKMSDYIVTLNSANPTRVVRPGDSFNVNDVKSVKISWQTAGKDTGEAEDGGTTGPYANLSGSGIFGDAGLLPPVLSVGLIQTSASFDMASFDMTRGEQTNRGTLYLVPAEPGEDVASSDNYEIAGGASGNYIASSGFLKSNDKTARNLPYVIKCSGDDAGYVCSAVIDLPGAVGGNKINDTFGIVLSLPYSDVGTDVRVEYFKESGTNVIAGVDDSGNKIEPLSQEGVQVEVDSTGRANELYRRVVTRLNVSDDAGQYPIYAIQLLGNNASEGDSLIEKNFWTTCEYNFGTPTC